MKLLASDYDGTLCYGDNVMDEDIDAIKRWREAGNLFVVCTGRAKESIDKQIAKHPFPVDYIVCNNGALVYNNEGELLQSIYMDYITSVDLMFIAKESEGVVSYVVNDGERRHKIIVNPDMQDYRYPTMQPDMTEEEVMDIGRYTQIVLSMTSPDYAVEFAKDINSFFSSTLVAYANNYCVDIVEKGISKATGVEFVCGYANIDYDDLYTIGDSYNDLPLLETSPNGYTIFTAPEELKNQAKNVYMSIKELIDDIL